MTRQRIMSLTLGPVGVEKEWGGRSGHASGAPVGVSSGPAGQASLQCRGRCQNVYENRGMGVTPVDGPKD